MRKEELWKMALGEIELSISKANFVTWFKNTHILSLENKHVVIGVPNGFAKEWLENKYRGYILKALQHSDKLRDPSRPVANLVAHDAAVGVQEFRDVCAVHELIPGKTLRSSSR